MRIAIDVDGVLADHVSAVLSRLRTEHDGFTRTKSTMTHWDEELPALDTSLKPEIEAAESDSSFVREMPSIEGAVEGTSKLANRGHELVIVTARPEEILPVTHDWLEANGIPHIREESLSTRGQMKTVADTEVLIDDYPGHIQDFAEAGKYAILFVQPWNKAQVNKLTESDRVFAAKNWEQVLNIIQSISTTTE